MTYNQYAHDGRQQTYQLQAPNQQASLDQPGYSRDIPRYDPHSTRIAQPQILGHTPSEGGAGTTFSVKLADVRHDPSAYKFVFGQKKVGAFLERSPGENASVLVAQVPRYKDTNWWSNKVPVYLLTLNTQTGEGLYSVQICEFTFTDSPAVRKRARDDAGLDLLSHGSPIKRPTSQPPMQYPGMRQQLPNPSFSSLQDSNFSSLGHRPSASQSYSMPLGYPTPGLQSFDKSYLQQPYGQDHQNERYIAEPRDHYAGQLQNVPQTYAAPSIKRSPSDPYSYVPGSLSAAPVWRATPAHSVYVSPPPSSTLSKSDIPFPDSGPQGDDSSENAPPLQRTSTLSSERPVGVRPPVTNPSPSSWIPTSKAKLEVMGELEDMARNWTAEEFSIRRRLVQVWRKQEGNVIKINFRPVDPGAVRPPHAVIISCIYWEERQECFFTSVDAIYLLESLVGNRFAVEEKNRIRRNLEGFRPLTVSKGKQDSEHFFKLIMSFPAPKPRNIEKDVKAFPWRILTTALRKIIGKYSANYGSLNLTERVAGDTTGESGRSSNTPPNTEMPPPPSQPPAMRRTQTIDSSLLESPFIVDTPARPATTSPRPLTIRVPPTDHESLPTLDSSLPSSSEFERRTSGSNGVPLSGLSNFEFSDFMFSASPSLNSLFPPPSALFERPEL